MTPHLTPFALERYAVADLPPAETEQVQMHLNGCAKCQAELTALSDLMQRELDAWPQAEFMATLDLRRKRETRRRGAWFGGATALTLTAGIWLFVTQAPEAELPENQVTARRDVVALRGTGIALQRKRGAQVQALQASDSIRAGDALRVLVTLASPALVDVWFLDTQGEVDHPLSVESLALPAGEQAIPGSAVVSEPCEDLWVVVGVGPGAGQKSEAALKRLGPGNRDASLNWVPHDCFALALRCE